MPEIDWILGREYETRGVGAVRYVAYLHDEPVYKYRVHQITGSTAEYGVNEHGRYFDADDDDAAEDGCDVISGPLPVEGLVETCGNCRFFLAYRHSDGVNRAVGNCRFMPQMVEKLDVEWCGQWEAKR